MKIGPVSALLHKYFPYCLLPRPVDKFMEGPASPEILWFLSSPLALIFITCLIQVFFYIYEIVDFHPSTIHIFFCLATKPIPKFSSTLAFLLVKLF